MPAPGTRRNSNGSSRRSGSPCSPTGQEAWSEFRRTGYPKVIPIVNNLSGGKVDTNVQVRRMTFPRSEYSNNAAGVAAATALLGGADTGGTKLWWDKK